MIGLVRVHCGAQDPIKRKAAEQNTTKTHRWPTHCSPLTYDEDLRDLDLNVESDAVVAVAVVGSGAGSVPVKVRMLILGSTLVSCVSTPFVPRNADAVVVVGIVLCTSTTRSKRRTPM